MEINDGEAKVLYAATIRNAAMDAKRGDVLSAMWLLSDECAAAVQWIGFEYEAVARSVGEMVFGGEQ